MNKGTVFAIERNSMHDGPGIRSVVFLKGCPLRCAWCHNPESYSPKPQLMFNALRCQSCGRCAEVCALHTMQPQHIWDAKKCMACGKCAEVCLNDALTICGREMTVDAVMQVVQKDRVFYDTSGGGVTISGGEPLFQPEFTAAIAAACKHAHISLCVETGGFAAWEHFLPLLAYTEKFLFDWKLTDPVLHRKYTGQDNAIIRRNLEKLNEAGASVILRCPILPGINDTQSHFSGIAALANSLACIESVHLEPYHSLGQSKARKIGLLQESFSVPQSGDAENWAAQIAELTAVPVTTG